jgi:uncharacterized membrane protein YkoI
MNMHTALFVLAATAATSSVYADKISLEQAPPAVREAILSKTGGQPIEDIDREVRNGQTVYEASFKSGGTQQELLVSEAGTILRDAIPPSTGLANNTLTLANRQTVSIVAAPTAVQNALRTGVQGSTIESVDKGIWNGQTIYEASFTRNGQRMTYQVNEAGKPVISKNPAIPAQQKVAKGKSPKYAGLSPNNVPLSGGAKMQVINAPTAVQRTVQQLSGGANIEDFERGQWNGRTVYEAAFKKNGQHVELQILEDGSVLTSGPTVASTTTTPTALQPRYAGLSPSNVPISGGAKIPFIGAPQAVQDAVNLIAAGANIEDMERGQWNGRTVYEAAFKKNGQHIELQVLEDGSIVTHGPAGSAVGGPASGTITTIPQ